jgi:chromosome segregation ATPase
MLPASDLLSLMTKIEQLEGEVDRLGFKVADEQAESERLEAVVAHLKAQYQLFAGKGYAYRNELAEREATIAALKYALDHYQHGGSNYAKIAKEALSIPSPTEHLSQYVTDAVAKRLEELGSWVTNDASHEAYRDKVLDSVLNLKGEACEIFGNDQQVVDVIEWYDSSVRAMKEKK